MKKVAVIIVDYLKAEKVVQNVKSLITQKTNVDFKIYIIDNSENQDNATILKDLTKLPQVYCQINPQNEGYTRAHNQLIQKLQTDYFLLVNPDIYWSDNQSLEKMIDFMDQNQQVGLMGPKQLTPPGEIEINYRKFPSIGTQICRRTFLKYLPVFSKLVQKYEMQHIDSEKIQTVDWLQSSCVIIRKDLWDMIGGFNEDYFLFMADTEIAYHIKKLGYEVIYNPKIVVQADGQRLSAGGVFSFFTKKAFRLHCKDAWKYYQNQRKLKKIDKRK